MFTQKIKFYLFLLLTMCSGFAYCATLQDIKFAELPGERAEIRLSFDDVPSEPEGYTIEQPARIVLDFANVTNGLPEKKYTMSVGEVSSAVVLEGGGRTRLIVNLDAAVPYSARIEGIEYVVEVGAESGAAASVEVTQQPEFMQSTQTTTQTIGAGNSGITNIDFRRGEVGEGKVIVSLSDPGISIDVEEVASGIEIRFLKTDLPEQLRRKLDVLDFATPVSMLSAQKEGAAALISIDTTGDYDYLAYQADNEYVVSVKPLTPAEIEEKERAFQYVGEKLSLNFQDIQVRSVLQLIADFTDLNLVASDTVSGSITLRLENVPWDQALDIVLKTKGLDKRQMGNVLMVGPAAEIAERERQEIETKKQLQELAPLRTEYIRVRYANARELFGLFMESGRGAQGGAGGQGGQNGRVSTGSILSERGSAIVDERTNSIILTDTEEKIVQFRRLIDQIDVAIPQVMIEARIVIANTNFRRELGVRISGAGIAETSANTGVPGDVDGLSVTGRLEGAFSDSGSLQSIYPTGPFELQDQTMVDLGVFNPAGALTWSLISSDFLLGMELSALETSGYAEIVSQPKVITGDKQPASIESGTEIPYQEESASGGTTTTFKEAVLKLDVTPQITPDNRVIMDLQITQDSIGDIDLASGIPILDITQLETQVLVPDGETVVLGGIYTVTSVNSVSKVPLLGDIPVVGNLFKNKERREDKREILIFITPRIMDHNITN